MHQRIAVLTFPAQLSSYTRTPHRMQAMSRRIGMEVKQHEFPLWEANVGQDQEALLPEKGRCGQVAM